MTMSPPKPPELWDFYRLDDPVPILRDVVGFEFADGVWFLTKVDRSVTAIPLRVTNYQLRPA